MTSNEDMSALLADEFVHYVRLLNFHWNVEGPDFLVLHEYFEDLYRDSRIFIDECAERIRSSGNRPLSTMAEYKETAHISENGGTSRTSGVLSAERMIEVITADREHMLEDLHAYIERAAERDDPTSEDFFTSRARDHEAALYKLRSIAA